MSKDVLVHPTADVQTTAMGRNTRIWQFCVVLPGAIIGVDCNIGSHCFIENDVIIGDRVTVKSGVQMWDGLRVDDDVFIGPNTSFANDCFPRSKQLPQSMSVTQIAKGASIGAGAIILPAITIGAGAIVAAGAVITKNIPPHAIVRGNPARITGYVDSGSRERAHAPITIDPGMPRQQLIGVGASTLHYLKQVGDLRGKLSVGEIPADIPFEPKRYFIVYDVPSKETRGEHAHRTCHQFLICITGNCAVVADDGVSRREVVLDTPSKGVYLPPMIWGIQYKYSSDAVLLVFASHLYDPDDYIRDYREFVSLVEIGRENVS